MIDVQSEGRQSCNCTEKQDASNCHQKELSNVILSVTTCQDLAPSRLREQQSVCMQHGLPKKGMDMEAQKSFTASQCTQQELSHHRTFSTCQVKKNPLRGITMSQNQQSFEIMLEI